MNDKEIDTVVARLLKRGHKYNIQAYYFIFEALEHTIRHVVKKEGHVTAGELLEGAQLCAFNQFGPLSKIVFELWGIKNASDFGEIVFDMVTANMLGKTETDSLNDFNVQMNIEERCWRMFFDEDIECV